MVEILERTSEWMACVPFSFGERSYDSCVVFPVGPSFLNGTFFYPFEELHANVQIVFECQF